LYDSLGHAIVPSTAPATSSDYLLVGWFTDAEYHNAFVSDSTAVNSDLTLYPQIIEKNKVAYTVNIYQMGIDGEYPDMPISIVATDHIGEQVTYVIPSYVGFTLNPNSSKIAGTMASADLVLNFYYDRMYASEFSISYVGGAPISGYDPGVWTISGDTLIYNGNVYYGQTIDLVEASRVGHTWTGWTIDGETSTATSYTFDVVADGSSVKVPDVVATYSLNTYTVTLLTSHGYFPGGVKTLTYSVPYGASLGNAPPQIASAEGYTLIGWEENGVMIGNGMVMPARDVTFVAVWELNDYVFTYSGDSNVSLSSKANGNSITSGSSVSYGSQIILSMSFTNTYTLGTYVVKSNGVEVSLRDLGDMVSAPVQGVNKQTFTWTFVIEKDIDIEISSEISQYKVTYYLNGQSLDSEWIAPEGSTWNTYLVKNAADGANITVDEVPVVANGYVFRGWFSNQAMTVPIKVIDNISSDVPVYGRVDPVSYTIMFDSNGGNGTMENISAKFGMDVLVTNGFSLADSSFIGWYCVKNRTVHGNVVSNLASNDGDKVTLKAIWVTDFESIYDGADHTVGTGTYDGLTWHYSETPISVDNHGSHDSIPKRNVGTYTIYVAVEDSNKSSLGGMATITITPKELVDSMVHISGNLTYNGEEHSPIIDVTNHGFIGIDDYTISGRTSASQAAEYTFTVTAKGNYSGTVTKVWNIDSKVVGLGLSNNTFRYYPDTTRTVTVVLSGIVGSDDCQPCMVETHLRLLPEVMS